MTLLKAKGVVFEEYDMPGLETVNSIATGGGARTAWFKHSESTSWPSARPTRLPVDADAGAVVSCESRYGLPAFVTLRRVDSGAADFDYRRRPHCADTQRVM